MSQLIEFTDRGLFCRQGNFYIDPWKPVERAVITHAHSDHAYAGHKYYLSSVLTKTLMQARLGDNNYETLDWHEKKYMNGVEVSLHPAGHVIGSSQIRVAYKDEVWVASGDYKTVDDGISGAFEPVKCNVFITESTFGLPIYNWQSQEKIYEQVREFVLKNKKEHHNTVLIAYSLGKAQRILKALEALNETIYLHGAIWNMQQSLQHTGISFPQVERVTTETAKEKLREAIIVAPPGADGSPWMKRFDPYRTAICSGWMQVRGNKRRQNADAGFALSDHADWNGLLQAVQATGAEKVFVTHGFQSSFSRHLNELGIESAEVRTEYGNDEEETNNTVTTDIAND